MAKPAVTFSVTDATQPTAPGAKRIPLIMGTSSTGTTATAASHVVKLSSPAAVRSEFGYGPMVTEGAYIVQHGGPALFCKLPSTNAGTLGTITKTGSAGAAVMTLLGGTAPNDRYSLKVECTTGGALGTAEVRYSLDAWSDNTSPTWSEATVVPGSGEVVIGNSGMTVDFDTDLGAGDYWTAESTAPAPAAADITALTTNDVLKDLALEYDFIVLAGAHATASAAQLLAAALDPVITALEPLGRRKYGVLSSGIDAAANQSNITYEGQYLSFGYSENLALASLPTTAVGYHKISTSSIISARIASSLASTDPIRVASGQLPGLVAIDHDEAVQLSVDDLKISTLRTWGGLSGFYVYNSWIKNAADSSLKYTQHANIIGLACETLYTSQTRWIGSSVRTIAGGLIAEADAKNIEADIQAALDVVIGDASRNVGPITAEGTKGYASILTYSLDRTNNVNATETLIGTLAVQPLGYPRVFTVTVAFRVVPA